VSRSTCAPSLRPERLRASLRVAWDAPDGAAGNRGIRRGRPPSGLERKPTSFDRSATMRASVFGKPPRDRV
jgi:hypothetical protein